MRQPIFALVPLALAAALAGCPSAAPTQPGGLISNNAGGLVSNNGLGGLIANNSVSPEEQALRDQLNQQPAAKVPVRLGILFYNYQSGLKPEDQQSAMATIRDELVATGLVKTAFQIPNALLDPSPTLQSMRLLGARFQVDVIAVLSGQGGLQLSDAQPTSFWDSFGNKSWYEGRATVQGLAVDVATGLFVGSFNAAGQDGPKQVDRDNGFAAATYPMVQKAETEALENAKQRVVDSLTALKANQGH